MFLKLFPRYAGRARRGATVAGDNLRGTAVVVENAPKSLSRHDGASVIRACRQRCDDLVAETLVVPFCVIVHYVFGYRCAQVSLTERYEAVETLSTYGENLTRAINAGLTFCGAQDSTLTRNDTAELVQKETFA